MIIKPCKYMLLVHYQELIELDIYDKVNTSEESKQTALHSLEPPITFSDTPMLLGIFRFNALWIPFLRSGCFLGRVSFKNGTGKVQVGQPNPILYADFLIKSTSHYWTVKKRR